MDNEEITIYTEKLLFRIRLWENIQISNSTLKRAEKPFTFSLYMPDLKTNTSSPSLNIYFSSIYFKQDKE